MPMTFRARDGRDNNFHLIRHLAAAAVVLTHSYSVVTGAYESEPLVGWVGKSIGLYAVDVFFVVSGFLIARSLAANPDLLRFAVSRMLRIFPALMIAVAFASLVLGPFLSALAPVDYFADPDLARYIVGSLSTVATSNALPGLFQTLPEAGNVNEPLWTLKYELAAYVSIGLVTAAGILISRRPLAPVIVVGIVAGVVLAVARSADAIPGTLDHATHFVVVFYLGVAGYLLRRLLPLTLPGVILLAGAAILAAPTSLGELAEQLFIAYTVLWLAFLPRLPTGRLERVGDCSYGIYVYAFPIQQTLRLAYPEIEPLMLFAATLVLVLPLALASWHLIEKPCLDARGAIVARLAARRAMHGARTAGA